MKSYRGVTGEQRLASLEKTKEAIRKGIIPKPTKCEKCGQTYGRIDYHNETYKSPIEGLQQLCMLCHLMWHSRFRYKSQWKWYDEQIKKGKRFRPVSAEKLFEALKFNKLPELLKEDLRKDYKEVDLF